MSRLSQVLRKWVDEFIADMNRRNYSPRSVRAYRYDLLGFVAWVGQQANLNSPGDLSTPVLEQYQMHLMLRPSLRSRTQPRPMSAGARNRHLAELKSFFKYLKRTCKLLSNPSSELEAARRTQRLPKAILSVPEVARLLQAIPKNTASGLRDWAAVELLYGTGVRRFELLGLDLEDLRLAEELVHVLGKGDKQRVVPMGKAAGKALERYLREGRPQLVQGGHRKIFVSSHHGGPVSEDELLRAIRNHAQQAGIKKKIGFHQFRHTCATHMLRGGADLRSIQTLLGHSELNTTAIYTRVEVSDLRKTLMRCHPREKDLRPPDDTK
jgi:integrase/recombinase XerD